MTFPWAVFAVISKCFRRVVSGRFLSVQPALHALVSMLGQVDGGQSFWRSLDEGALGGRRGSPGEPVTLSNPQRTSDRCRTWTTVSSFELENLKSTRRSAKREQGPANTPRARIAVTKTALMSGRSHRSLHTGEAFAAEGTPCQLAMA
jgi:hypothetical protein